jgi:enolase
VLRHGTGETADTGLADLAVALRAGQVEAGPLGLTDAMVKYNQLLRIEEELGRNAVYAGAEWRPG